MKRTFFLIELVLAVLVLSFIFSTVAVFYRQIYSNYESLELFERLYRLEDEFFQTARLREIILQTDALKNLNLNEKILNDGLFELRGLEAVGQDYKALFYDEKNF